MCPGIGRCIHPTAVKRYVLLVRTASPQSAYPPPRPRRECRALRVRKRFEAETLPEFHRKGTAAPSNPRRRLPRPAHGSPGEIPHASFKRMTNVSRMLILLSTQFLLYPLSAKLARLTDKKSGGIRCKTERPTRKTSRVGRNTNLKLTQFLNQFISSHFDFKSHVLKICPVNRIYHIYDVIILVFNAVTPL